MVAAAKVISSLHIPNQTFFASRRSSNTHLVGLATICVRKVSATLYMNLLDRTRPAVFLFWCPLQAASMVSPCKPWSRVYIAVRALYIFGCEGWGQNCSPAFVGYQGPRCSSQPCPHLLSCSNDGWGILLSPSSPWGHPIFKIPLHTSIPTLHAAAEHACTKGDHLRE